MEIGLDDVLSPAQIAEIYEAAIEDDGLARLVGIVSRIADVDSAGIWLRQGMEVIDLTVSESIAASMGPYLAYYARLDPWAAALMGSSRVTLGNEIVDEGELVQGEFYTDFARHFGMLRPMGATLDIGPGIVASVSTNRASRAHLLDASDKARFSVLAVHLRGALRLRHRLGGERVLRRDLAAAFDAMLFGAVICGPDGAVQFANDAARALEGARLLQLRGSGGALAAASSEQTARLRAAVAAAAGTGHPGGLPLTGADGLSVHALVTPLPGTVPDARRGRALVTLRRADAVAGPAAAVLRQLFALSPAQATLCVQLARGLTFEAAAEERGVALSTARTHFLGILQKTGTANLRDLLRLLGALPQTR